MMKQALNSLRIVILVSACILATSCAFFSAKSETKQKKTDSNVPDSKDYKPPKRIATIDDEAVKESSGVAASRRNKGIFWTHNDSGDGAFLYAFDRAGKKRGVFQVNGAKNVDWEDIAAYKSSKDGENYLLIGDTGNNEKSRVELTIYIVREPEVKSTDAQTSKKNPARTDKATVVRVKYPNNEKYDAETLLVNPATDDLYILTKDIAGASFVFKLSPPFAGNKTNELKKIAEVTMPSLPGGMLTGGDTSPDGKRVVLCDYFAAYELVLSTTAKNFDEVWKLEPNKIDLGEREQGESIAYSANGKALYATSEKRPTPFIEVERR